MQRDKRIASRACLEYAMPSHDGQGQQVAQAGVKMVLQPETRSNNGIEDYLHPAVQLKGVWLHKEDLAEAAKEPRQRHGCPTSIRHNLRTTPHHHLLQICVLQFAASEESLSNCGHQRSLLRWLLRWGAGRP